MVSVTRKEDIGLLDRAAPVLSSLGFFGAVLTYPPGSASDPLFGAGTAFTVMLLLPISYLLGVAGAVILSRRFVGSEDGLLRRLVVRAPVAAAGLVTINAYVIAATGFTSVSWVAIVSAATAAVAVIDELAGGFFA